MTAIAAQAKDKKPEFETLLEVPIAYSSSASGAVRLSRWKKDGASGLVVTLSKTQSRGRGNPSEFSSVTIPADVSVVGQVIAALERVKGQIHAK